MIDSFVLDLIHAQRVLIIALCGIVLMLRLSSIQPSRSLWSTVPRFGAYLAILYASYLTVFNVVEISMIAQFIANCAIIFVYVVLGTVVSRRRRLG